MQGPKYARELLGAIASPQYTSLALEKLPCIRTMTLPMIFFSQNSPKSIRNKRNGRVLKRNLSNDE